MKRRPLLKNLFQLTAASLACAGALADDILVDPMSTTTNWALTGQRVHYVLGQSKLEPASQPARASAKASLKLTCDLDGRSWVGMQWRGQPLPGRVEALAFWTHSDGSKHRLAARIEDANGRFFDAPLGALDWQGWRQVAVPMEETKWTPLLRHHEERLPVRWPVTLRELRITKSGGTPLLSSVAFSELRVTSRVTPLDRVAIVVATDAPANVFYLPQSVTLLANLKNPTDTALDGRVEIVVVDWLGHEQKFDGGALKLAARSNFERKLVVPMKTLGAYQAWVRFRVGDAVREASRTFAVSAKSSGTARLDPGSPFGMGLYLSRFQKDAELQQAIKLAREAGVKWTRGDMNIAHVAPQPGRWAWESVRWIDGEEGGAAELGAGRGFSVASSPSLNRPCDTGEITLALRMKFLTFDYPDRWRTLLGKREGPQRQFYLYLTVPTRQLGISFGDGRESWSDIHCAKSDWKTNQWYRLVVNHRRSDRSVRWWVDGAPAGKGETRFAGSLVPNNLPLEIGRGLDFALDDFAIYDRAFEGEPPKAAKPVARWTFNEDKGLRAADASGHKNHAAIPPFRNDGIFDQSRAAGISTFPIMMGTPSWMAAAAVRDAPRPWTLMPQTNLWADVIGRVAARYRGMGIRTWEIWNEPNIEPFWSPKPDAGEYCKVLAASYAAIKRADPQATVLGCSLAGPCGKTWMSPWEFVEDLLKRGGGRFMDAISIHPYRQPHAPEDSDYVGDIKAISDLTAKYGRRLPIWITEVGWPTDAAGSAESWQAKMLPRSYLLALAAGVKNVAWYDYHDDGPDPSYNEHNFGILRTDLTPKPSYFAFRTMATELAGLRFEREMDAGPGATVLLFAGNGRRVAVAWAHRREVALALRVGAARQIETVDLMGNASRADARDGRLLLTLTGAPVFLRNAPASLAAVRPIACEPAVLKLARGESGELRVTLRNPFRKPLAFRTAKAPVTIPPNGESRVTLRIAADHAASWQAPVWRSSDGRVELTTPARVVALTSQREPIFQRREETTQRVAVPDSPALAARDEVTVACRFRSDGPSDTWQAPLSKWDGESRRNYGLYLTRDKGELCFSASFEKGAQFTDLNSGVRLFDGRWHRVAATYSKHDAAVCFYMDGALVKRIAFDGGDLKSADAPLIIASGFNLTQDGKSTPRAAVRDVQVWNRALTATEIAALGR